jgi:2-iminoacetate synthase
MEAGIDDVGIGVLFGLYDWRFEILAMMQHIRHLEEKFGVGPHTISFPRIEPAVGSDIASRPPHAVSDADFLKMIAIMRLAVPYTGMIMSTREGRQRCAAKRSNSASLRFPPAAAPIQAAIRTAKATPNGSQFQLGDHRTVEEVVSDVVSLGFCLRSAPPAIAPGAPGGLYGSRQAGRDQVPLPSQRALHISGVPVRLREPQGKIRRRKAHLD